ncbi:hypothetical protein [Bacillus sp. 1P06AnD]|uniref:hypothetical protein n=1 Tax=Bacillus sp. 1P06AnD TaxID=3132208 RepID=UPI00399F6FDC
MKWNRTYITLLILFLYILIATIADQHYLQIYRKIANDTLTIPAYPLLHHLWHIPTGMILGLLTLSEQFNKQGRWRIKLLPFLVLFLPSAYFSLLPFLALKSTAWALPFAFISLETQISIIASVLVGFSAIFPWHKEKEKNTPLH